MINISPEFRLAKLLSKIHDLQDRATVRLIIDDMESRLGSPADINQLEGVRVYYPPMNFGGKDKYIVQLYVRKVPIAIPNTAPKQSLHSDTTAVSGGGVNPQEHDNPV